MNTQTVTPDTSRQPAAPDRYIRVMDAPRLTGADIDQRRLWALTPVHRPHLTQLLEMRAGLPPDVAGRHVVVSNGPDAPTPAEIPGATVLRGEDTRSVAAWWGQGMDHIAAHGGGDILFIDSDARTNPDTVTQLHAALTRYGLSYVGADRRGVLPEGGVWIRTEPRPYRDLNWRPTGYLFVLAGDHGIRPDPQYTHWYLDDDMERQALLAGGVGMVGGTWVDHPDHERWDEDTDAKRAADRARFIAKWGEPAW